MYDHSVNGLKEFIQKRNEIIYREKANHLFSNLSITIGAIEQEVSNKNILLRQDRNVLIDLGLQEILMKILFSYELPWLRLGLETVFGEILSMKNTMKNAMKKNN